MQWLRVAQLLNYARSLQVKRTFYKTVITGHYVGVTERGWARHIGNEFLCTVVIGV